MTEKKPGEPDERIVAAAIQREGVVFTGAHHHQIIRYVAVTLDLKTVTGEQGFMTSTGRFVGRAEAAHVAFDSGQMPDCDGPRGLFSEQLWNLSDYPPSEVTEEARREGAREVLERAAKICHDLYAETGRYLGPLIRALADQPEAVVQRHLQCGYPLDQCKCKPAKAEHICGLSGYNPMIDLPCPHPSHGKADALPLGHAYTGMGDPYGCTRINPNPIRIVCCGEPEAAHGRKPE